MLEIIVAFARTEDAAGIRNILVRSGYEVTVCLTGAQAIKLVNEREEGILICGYRLPDMHFLELNDYLPRNFSMLLLASPQRISECQDNRIISLAMPFKPRDVVNTVEMMCSRYQRRRKKERDRLKERSEEEKALISKAKVLLMERNNLSEEEAHRYMQKTSMDNGYNLVETAQMLLAMLSSI